MNKPKNSLLVASFCVISTMPTSVRAEEPRIAEVRNRMGTLPEACKDFFNYQICSLDSKPSAVVRDIATGNVVRIFNGYIAAYNSGTTLEKNRIAFTCYNRHFTESAFAAKYPRYRACNAKFPAKMASRRPSSNTSNKFNRICRPIAKFLRCYKASPAANSLANETAKWYNEIISWLNSPTKSSETLLQLQVQACENLTTEILGKPGSSINPAPSSSCLGILRAGVLKELRGLPRQCVLSYRKMQSHLKWKSGDEKTAYENMIYRTLEGWVRSSRRAKTDRAARDQLGRICGEHKIVTTVPVSRTNTSDSASTPPSIAAGRPESKLPQPCPDYLELYNQCFIGTMPPASRKTAAMEFQSLIKGLLHKYAQARGARRALKDIGRRCAKMRDDFIRWVRDRPGNFDPRVQPCIARMRRTAHQQVRTGRKLEGQDRTPTTPITRFEQFLRVFIAAYSAKDMRRLLAHKMLDATAGYYTLVKPGAVCAVDTSRRTAAQAPWCKSPAPGSPGEPCSDVDVASVPNKLHRNSSPKGGCEGYPRAADGFHYVYVRERDLPSYTAMKADGSVLGERRVTVPRRFRGARVIKVVAFKNQSALFSLYFLELRKRWVLFVQQKCDECGS